MLPIEDVKDKRLFTMIISYLQAGGSPGVPFVQRFCTKYQIDASELSKCMTSPQAETMLDRLKKLGMIQG